MLYSRHKRLSQSLSSSLYICYYIYIFRKRRTWSQLLVLGKRCWNKTNNWLANVNNWSWSWYPTKSRYVSILSSSVCVSLTVCQVLYIILSSATWRAMGKFCHRNYIRSRFISGTDLYPEHIHIGAILQSRLVRNVSCGKIWFFVLGVAPVAIYKQPGELALTFALVTLHFSLLSQLLYFSLLSQLLYL